MSESLDRAMTARIKASQIIANAFLRNMESQKDDAEICIVHGQAWPKVAKVFSEFHNFRNASQRLASEDRVYVAELSTGLKLCEGYSHRVEVDDFASAFQVCHGNSDVIYFESSSSKSVLLACRMDNGWSVLSFQPTHRGEPYNWFKRKYERSSYSKRFLSVFGL